ncbi:MAG: hypothetical protein QNJ31_08225 [Candidatus Caenarcaniphilales bacterium]|nr:hypothetical protein [Candidatus Caenarcaniphilales bacterium]
MNSSQVFKTNPLHNIRGNTITSQKANEIVQYASMANVRDDFSGYMKVRFLNESTMSVQNGKGIEYFYIRE